MEKCLIAVDSGRTKIKITVFSMEKEELLSSTFSAGSPSAFGRRAFKNIEEGLDYIYTKIKGKYLVEYIQMGISGLGSVSDVGQLEEEFARKYQTKVSMENDALIALYSLFRGQYDQGILVLGGTGSAVYGMVGTQTLLVGGWGHLLEEKGSAYQVVRRAFLNIIDKHEHNTYLSTFDKAFMTMLGVADVYLLKPVFYQNPVDKIASYSQFISELALKGDKDAINLLKDSGKGIATDVAIAFSKLPFRGPVPIGFQGSYVNNAPFVKEEALSELKRLNLEFEVIESKIEPIMGALYRALEKVNKC